MKISNIIAKLKLIKTILMIFLIIVISPKSYAINLIVKKTNNNNFFINAILPYHKNLRIIKQFKVIPYLLIRDESLDIKSSYITPTFINNAVIDYPTFKPSIYVSTKIIKSDDVNQDYGLTGNGYVVGVLDTWIDKNHDFIKGKIVEEACFSTNSSYSKSLCRNGREFDYGFGSSVKCDLSECYHGTFVVGIINGKNNFMNGVAPNSKIIAVNVFSLINNSSICYPSKRCLRAFTSDILSGLEYIYMLRHKYKIASVNLSLGTSKTYPYPCKSGILSEIFKLYRKANIPIVVASGNNGKNNGISFPACSPDVISVGASNCCDEKAFFSNSSPYLTIFAPGQHIYSSIPENHYAYSSGTSFSTPFVSSAIALLKEFYPFLEFNQIKESLQSSNQKIRITDSDEVYYIPRLNIKNAIEYVYRNFDIYNLPDLEVIDIHKYQNHLFVTIFNNGNVNIGGFSVVLSNGLQSEEKIINYLDKFSSIEIKFDKVLNGKLIVDFYNVIKEIDESNNIIYIE